MAPLQRSARRARPRNPRAFLTARDDLEVRIVPALIGPTVTAPSVVVQPGSQPIEPDGGSGSPSGYTPQQIRTAYGVDGISFGSITGDGAGQTIAIVDAYDDPGLVDSSASNFSTSDLAEFDQAFGLPDPPSFTKLNEYGSTTGLPGTDPAGPGSASGNWEYEEAMDVEWAHAIAPAANILLVEANSNSVDDLYSAISTAANLAGVSVVSLSWGSPEFSGESSWDSYFETPSGHQGVTFVAASGDRGSPGIYPASSPNVVAAGGTTLTLGSNGSYEGETAWSGSGGGVSSYESEPAYQDGVQSTGYRTIPDVAFVADRSTGVAVYDSYDNTGGGPWNEMGGTSLAAPSWAALIAIADQGRVALGGTTLDGVTQTLPALYSLPSTDFHDITTGSNGGYNAGPGYDEVTGLGSPVANLLVPNLASYGMPDQLVVTAQPPGSVSAGSPFGLTVEVESPSGQLITGATGTVTLSLANDPGGAALNGTLTATINQGVATFSGLSIDRAGTGYSLLVSGNSLDSATSGPFNVVPAAASQLVISTQPAASLTAGSAFGLTVSVEDMFGNLETSDDGSVTLALGVNPAGGSLNGDLTASASGGVADFSGLTLDQAGTGYTIQATASGLSAATTQSFDVTPATPAQLVVTTEPASAITAGTGFGLSVSVEDVYGNLETSYGGNLALTLIGGPGGASFSGTLTLPASGGVADFSGLTLDRAGTGYAIQAVGTGLSSATTSSFSVIPAAPTQLVVTAEPAPTISAGDGFILSASIEDAYGNLETTDNRSVSIALSGGPSGASLGGTTAVPATSGVASFSGLTLDQAGSGYAIQVASNGLTAATTTAFTVSPAAPAQLAITAQPATSVTAGQTFGVTVAVEDAFGNAEPSYDGDITLSLAGDAAGTNLGGDLTIAADDGIARFSGLSLDRADSGDTLQASGDGLSGASTTAFDVAPAAASQLVMVAQPPTTLTAGQPFGFTVAAEDPFGNVVTGFNGRVSASMAHDPAGTPLSGVVMVTADNGLARFSGLTIDKAGAGYTVNAASANLSETSTDSINVSPAVATRLVITVQPPTSVTAGNGFGLMVTAEDPFGNVDTSFQGVVTASLSPGLDAGMLSGTTGVSAVNGVASFSDLVLTRAVAGDPLQLASGGLLPVTTNPFAVNPAAPMQVVLISQPPGKVPVHQSFTFTAAVEDAFGNIVTDYNGSVSVTLSNHPGHARFHGPLTVQASAGVAVFDGSMSKQRGTGTNTLSVSTLGLTPATSNVFKVAHPNPASSVFVAHFRHGRLHSHALRLASRRSQ